MFLNRRKLLIISVLNIVCMVCFCRENHLNNNNKPNEKSQQQEIWEEDLTDTFKIEGSDQGIQKVNLKCGSDSMHVILETEKPFSGVMYTRGSFYKQTAPCFVKPTSKTARSIEMNFRLDQCQTAKEGELYTNVVVIQNDPDLITPGDSAFSLECDFRSPRSLDVKADMQTRDRIAFGSKITLTSPDPSVSPTDTSSHISTVHSDSDTVAYITQVNKTNTSKTHSIDQNGGTTNNNYMGSVLPVNISTLQARDELKSNDTKKSAKFL